MIKLIPLTFSLLIFLASCSKSDNTIGHTEITKWKDGKPAAISITYDDATINQFRQALPIMDTLGLKGTFFVNTNHIQNSEILPKFIGRPIADIIKETASIATDQSTLFERASALRYTGLKGATELHNNAGSLFENDKITEACKVIDEAYARVRKEKPSVTKDMPSTENMITWEEAKEFAARGHEFGSHTITHPRLAVLDEPNMLYELEKSKEEIEKQLGPDHTFSAECPFGTENERVMEYAHKVYPALRNRMPEPYLEEYNRSSKMTPAASDKEYIQWQRGPLTKTTLEEMKSYVDTLLVHDNVWLVLTFHGVDGIGWEAIPHERHAAYFRYMKEKEDKLWVATFKDVTKYMRERMSAKVNVKEKGDKIVLNVDHSLDKKLYNVPLTLKTYVPDGWKEAVVKQAGNERRVSVATDEKGAYVLYEAKPDSEDVVLAGI